jgi:hypothetical protein
MSYKPIVQTVGKVEIRCQPLRVLAAFGACLLFFVYFIPFSIGSAPDISRSSRDLETDSSPGFGVSHLGVSPSDDAGISHKPLVLAGDSVVRVETEDLGSLEEDPGHPQAFLEANLIPLGKLSRHVSPRAPFVPFLAIHGLMSRRF